MKEVTILEKETIHLHIPNEMARKINSKLDTQIIVEHREDNHITIGVPVDNAEELSELLWEVSEIEEEYMNGTETQYSKLAIMVEERVELFKKEKDNA